MLFSTVLVLPLGPIIGSWLGVLIRHWPATWRDGWRRSVCLTCGTNLTSRDLIPLFSFVASRGRCRHCGAPIGWFPPAIELAALLVAAVVLAADGSAPVAWADAALGWALLLAAWIDAETFILPNAITLPLVLTGLAASWWFDAGAIYDHAAAAALGYLGFVLLNASYRLLRRRDGLGAGDAKLLAAGGAWLGVAALPDVVFLAAVLGLLAIGTARLAGRSHAAGAPVPFGPALALAIFALRLTAA